MAGFPLGGFGALGSGFMQGEQAAAVARQQMQMRQLQQQMQIAAMLQQLQQSQRFETARAQTPPAEQRAIDLGEPPGEYEKQQQITQGIAQKRQALISEANATSEMLAQSAADPSLQPQERAMRLQMAYNLRTNPELITQFKNIQPLLNAPKPAPAPHVFTSGKDLFAFEGKTDANGNPIPSALGLPAPASKALDEDNTPFKLWKAENPGKGYADWIKASTAGKPNAASVTTNDINIALDQMQGMVKQLRAQPGVLGGLEGSVLGRARAFGGYTNETAFQEAAASLSDMIPKALSGRANQSSINNALKYMVPAFNDTQESAQRKINNLRQLFIRSGVLTPSGTTPSIGTMEGAVGTPVTDASGRVTSFKRVGAPRDTP